MKIVAKKKLWKYLFWLGPFLIAVGLTVGLVSEQWGLIPLVFLITGIVISGLGIIWQSYETNWWKRRSTQAGTNALVATLAVLAILGLINFLGTRYHLRADLTESQLFTLAPQSRELVSVLPQPVKVWVFDINQNPQDRELLENYQRQSSKFKYEYIDPQARPGVAEKFGVKDYGEVYLESGEKRQLVQTVNQNERLSEIRLTSRLQQLTNSTTAKVYLLQGHGERQLSPGKDAISQAVQGLGDKNFTTSPLNLGETSKVPQDASVVIVAGPKRGLFEGEVKALQEYLNRGGNLLLMIDPNTDPKLNSLLQEWGVRLDNRLAVDVSGESVVGLGPAAPLVTEYGQHPITKDFGNGNSFYPISRPLEITSVPGVQATPLLRTKPYPKSWAESDLQSEKLEFNEGKDLKGPLTLGVALTRKQAAKSASIPQASPTPSPLPSPTTQGKTSSTPSASRRTPQASPLPSPTTQGKATPTPSASRSTPQASPLPSPTTQGKATPTPTSAATASPTPSSQTATESRLVVLGNSNFATDGLFQQQLNGDVFLNSVTWLSQQDQQPLSIRPKEPKNRRITLTTTQGNFLILSSLLILPLIGFAIAVLIWWKRR
ncbi:ABC transporter [Nostoc sp. 'Peltigera membranacea cyanobiont' 213]|uniref:GldG family protein n=1 Tax=unclassified Nostoc TaxID=2593658 RepID=UPI000B95AEC2|nr:Gldg family protein [Nostoc sp. 'Peltigera membranacea cyanobiont' 213]OYD99625.1 ABC transporter [Nostoc sp. 'Peltigera membranacea cyanobiont' 213]